ncbi:hypothetical protein [Teredinibacter purpureus]|uniref:hypothetical protein n=1 Tax=Teredinibacter purpureus TaxID=2731756 RepID=UPI0005F7E114|nr:hypothetical protein [Teredinibacter purpureus]
MKQIITILLFFVCSNSYSGGEYYDGLLLEYVEPFEEGSEFHLTLNFTGEGIGKNCNSILVKGIYDQEYWSGYKRPMSLSGHAEAMEYLSGQVGSKIKFGQIGRGLKKLHGCTYLSRGLFLEQHGKEPVVFSVHEKI